MHSPVFLQLSISSETLATNLTLELQFMSTHVHRQVCVSCERFPTRLAHVRSDSQVHAAMLHQVVFLDKALVTIVADKRRYCQVALLMCRIRVLCGQTLAAQLTSVLHSCVQSFVCVERTCVCKELSADITRVLQFSFAPVLNHLLETASARRTSRLLSFTRCLRVITWCYWDIILQQNKVIKWSRLNIFKHYQSLDKVMWTIYKEYTNLFYFLYTLLFTN